MTVNESVSRSPIPWSWSTHHSIWSAQALPQTKCDSYHKPSSKSKLFRCVRCLQRFAHVLSRSRYFDLIRWSLVLYLLADIALNVLLLLFFPEILDPLSPRLSAFWPSLARLAFNHTLLPPLLALLLLLDLFGLLSLLLLCFPLALLNVCHLSFALLKLAAAFNSTFVLAAHAYFVLLAVLFAMLLPHRPYPPVWTHPLSPSMSMSLLLFLCYLDHDDLIKWSNFNHFDWASEPKAYQLNPNQIRSNRMTSNIDWQSICLLHFCCLFLRKRIELRRLFCCFSLSLFSLTFCLFFFFLLSFFPLC